MKASTVDKIIEMYKNGMSVRSISLELGIGDSVVRKPILKAGIMRKQIRSQASLDAESTVLADKDWLFEQYITQCKSPQTIADEIDVRRSLVSRAIKRHKIPKRVGNTGQKNRRANAVKEMAEDIAKMIAMYEEGSTIGDIATNLNIGYSVVRRSLLNNNIKIRGSNKEDLEQAAAILADKDWLFDQYITKGKSATQIANEINTGSDKVKRALIKHNITLRTHKESQAGRTDDRLRTGIGKDDRSNDLELIKSMYVDQRMNKLEIAEELGIDVQSVGRRLKKTNTKIRQGAESRPLDYKISEETRAKMSKTASEQIRNGTRASTGRGISSVEDTPNQGKVTVRSSWEAAFIHHLNKNNIDFWYERDSFLLSNGKTYTPDFYLPSTDMYIEIKGKMSGSSRTKYKLFRAEYAKVKWKILYGEFLKQHKIIKR